MSSLLWIGSAGKNVLRFDPASGQFLGVFVKDNLAFPFDLVFVGNLLCVSNASNGTISSFDARSGEFRGVVATLPDHGVPTGLAFDGEDGSGLLTLERIDCFD